MLNGLRRIQRVRRTARLTCPLLIKLFVRLISGLVQYRLRDIRTGTILRMCTRYVNRLNVVALSVLFLPTLFLLSTLRLLRYRLIKQRLKYCNRATRSELIIQVTGRRVERGCTHDGGRRRDRRREPRVNGLCEAFWRPLSEGCYFRLNHIGVGNRRFRHRKVENVRLAICRRLR